MQHRSWIAGTLAIALLAMIGGGNLFAEEFIPRKQTKPPGPPLSPEEARAKFKVPEGFVVELVAAEPDIVNPVAMAFDERGRIYVTESLEYPRKEPGPGRDRIKILEDTDGDGRIDKTTVFAEGLNIPSGIAVGHGGVWVANAPDILFMQDTDGDDKADVTKVIVTGFGRDDTHELPNSLTWGPDGYLYGLNGVFNRSKVTQDGKTYDFTCAVFRIDPRTGKFSLFAEGTSNPWGIAFDSEGSMFLSACVIDHLWHIVETGYYHRQGGPYPPFTWKIESIVEHQHQLAAYCGIVWFDSDAYPPEFRGHLYMGNIHGNCVNVDALSRNGSTYRGEARPDFFSTDDVWHMPVAQKVGPDGNLYVLDWYDRYHCYQDANRDPAGIDRLKGRLWRIRYAPGPANEPYKAPKLDLAKESNDQLIARLASANVFIRETAQRLLNERMDDPTRQKLEKLTFDTSAPRQQRLHGMWAAISDPKSYFSFVDQLLHAEDATLRAWGVRTAGNYAMIGGVAPDRIVAMIDDPSPDVRLQLAIAARKIPNFDDVEVLCKLLEHSPDDQLITQVMWENLHPLLETKSERFVSEVSTMTLKSSPALEQLLPRAVERMLASKQVKAQTVASLITTLIEQNADGIAAEALGAIVSRHQNGQLGDDDARDLVKMLEPSLAEAQERPDDSEFHRSATLLRAEMGDKAALEEMAKLFRDAKAPAEWRIATLHVMLSARDASVSEAAVNVLTDRQTNESMAREVIGALSRSNDANLGTTLLAAYDKLRPNVRPQVIELLTQRPGWALTMLDAVESGTVSRDLLNVNQVRKLATSKDTAVAEKVRSVYGAVREGRNPNRERVIADVKQLFEISKGDPRNGQAVFARVCAQCHTIYGQGQQIGPDITVNGRGSFDQLLSNVLDPNLVIGTGYQLATVTTRDGRTLAGMLAEQNEQRVVVRTLGGGSETVARADVAGVNIAPISFMPEGLEASMSKQELVDLLTFLSLENPPGTAGNEAISGTPGGK